MDNIVIKIHRLNSVFNKSATTLIPIDALCDELCDIINCNIYLFDVSGNIRAYAIAEKFSCKYTACSLENKRLPQYYLKMFLQSNISVLDMYEKNPKCTYPDVDKCLFKNRYYSIYPIFSAYKKVGGILFIKYEEPFSESDMVLCEYTRAIVLIEILRQEQEKIQQISMDMAKAKVAVDSLTFSEKKALKAILDEIDGNVGEIFLNSIASKTYTTPSTVSSVLKKAELASLIFTKSRGVKGKQIKILNENIRNELDKFDKNPRINY
ncbi:hypothetical protein HZF24_02465 [Sedimentibacter hydroxybenzoicus DSM 7310]|uniref:Global transcriptional regulator CodY N-terminal domain-containing protein n=1 Tax=Sedimentibacter hydroxybenzoicus DSM 7310 TaxID=1123245 RepID=A0A974BHK6_SEDHY|nr:hypothetical protein [Sedimentibacter hydroxybenzoicus]NYB73001.1 hypothetical protein [Sedimentibacter hydroxybenzoicus DSM 7310]